ncbi:Uncharacterized protein Adt_06691 [Abeliophyllum distichum]|uniref:Uncharacterized protein n=1 Tax=Abeliophyllum distichum TaxID=126358 RepID=A0ABD1V7L5_9LAMI
MGAAVVFNTRRHLWCRCHHFGRNSSAIGHHHRSSKEAAAAATAVLLYGLHLRVEVGFFNNCRQSFQCFVKIEDWPFIGKLHQSNRIAKSRTLNSSHKFRTPKSSQRDEVVNSLNCWGIVSGVCLKPSKSKVKPSRSRVLAFDVLSLEILMQ